tara:strand:+ start:3204 stop:3575 length:372 start_codon:yes stop_codon:yes gene_type:complete
MALVNKVEQKAKVSIDTVIQFQIVTYCFFNDIQISNADLKCLAQLAKQGEVELTLFCNDVTDMGIFKSPQSARNAITKASKKDLVIKNGYNKKKITLSKILNVQTEGNVFLDYKILGIESKES